MVAQLATTQWPSDATSEGALTGESGAKWCRCVNDMPRHAKQGLNSLFSPARLKSFAEYPDVAVG